MTHPTELLHLIDFENNVIKDIKIEKDSVLHVLIDKPSNRHNYKLKDLASIVKVIIKIEGRSFTTNFDRPFIHQIFGRVWYKLKEYESVAFETLKCFNEEYQLIIPHIENILKSGDIVIRYNKETFKIYGIVTRFFKPSNQLEFRESFINAANNSHILDTKTTRPIFRPNDFYFEEGYKFINDSQSVKLECSLIYGKNTGYNSYKNRWYRKSIDNSNSIWFSPWESSNQYEWRNNSHSEIKDFVNYLIKEGIQHQDFINEKVIQAKDKNLARDFINFFLNKMQIANITKIKVRDTFTFNLKHLGNTAWNLSNSLRTVGSLDKKATPKATQWLLIECGTKIIEENYKVYLESNDPIALVGNYNY